MFCPSCRSEFRPGFTRCASCDVALVDSLPTTFAAPARHAPTAGPPPLAHAMPLTGYFDLDEARGARAQLHRSGLRSDILIRETSDPAAASGEEYWIRVEAADLRRADAVLGGPDPQVEEPVGDDEAVRCSACDEPVDEEATQCPNCGARFE